MKQTLKKTPTRVKFDGMTFLHNGKCKEGNHEPKEYLILNGVRYFKVRKSELVTEVEDSFDYEDTIELPTKDEIRQLEEERKVKVKAEYDSPEAESSLEKIKWDPRHPGKKTKAQYLNPKTGNYVSYIRAIQLKLT